MKNWIFTISVTVTDNNFNNTTTENANYKHQFDKNTNCEHCCVNCTQLSQKNNMQIQSNAI